MVRFFTLLSLFVGSLFAHGKAEDHVHFFNSLHVEGLVLFLVTFILGVATYLYFKKRA
jgi:hypothetical protein